MSNIFDIVKSTAFKTTTRIMGYTAEWYDGQQELSFTARVHFRYPSVKEELAGIDYYPTEPRMEYMQDQFPMLKARVDAGNNEEVSIDGIGDFYVRAVERKNDGDLLVAILAEK
jgi:hypothetical protein